jgi:malic enzyme
MKIPEILLVETVQRPGSLASVLSVIADEQLVIEHLQALRRGQGRTLWEITVEIDESANPQFYSTIDALPNARFVGKSDRVLNRHRGGKIRMQPTLPITTTQILRDVYTPGVARVCLAIRDDPANANLYTNLPNIVAVVTNGTAVCWVWATSVERADLPTVMRDADVVIATTGVQGLIRPEWVRKGQLILALSNPDAEIEPIQALEHGAAFAADGKSINNVSGFPGLFKGALEARATRFSDAMLMAAATTLSRLAGADALLPDPLDLEAHAQVAAAVRAAASTAGGSPR